MLIANGRSLGLCKCTFEMPAQIMPGVAGITAAPIQGLAMALPGPVQAQPYRTAKGLCIGHLYN